MQSRYRALNERERRVFTAVTMPTAGKLGAPALKSRRQGICSVHVLRTWGALFLLPALAAFLLKPHSQSPKA